MYDQIPFIKTTIRNDQDKIDISNKKIKREKENIVKYKYEIKLLKRYIKKLKKDSKK